MQIQIAMTKLTPREIEIMDLLSKGLTQQEIAYRKGWHYNTVKGVVVDIKIKLDCDNLFQLGMKYHVLSDKENRVA